ncbi:hypothetical protein [Pedobacter sp. SL55]|uniref:hypothetical protein n=1 Tax=Pedobacter sp. SL55 TaxID=2995161 RepID=UPI00226FEED7|nr:hypothetical protein [Pedobacter sp. SL55]WAC40552.1 hypothetical protein OVA16_18605 [Pedobacter sp. SL55]
MKAKLTQIEELQAEMAIYKALLCANYRLQECVYDALFKQAGIAFAECNAQCQETVKKLLNTAMYWNWFKIKWHQFNVAFYTNHAPNISDNFNDYLRHHTAYLEAKETEESFNSKLTAMLKYNENRMRT